MQPHKSFLSLPQQRYSCAYL